MSDSDSPRLCARTGVAALASIAVGAAGSAAARLAGTAPTRVDPSRIAVAYSSERWFRLNGEQPAAFGPLSAFFETSDGWVRTHGTYPHHASALRRGLGLDAAADRDAVVAALRRRDRMDVSHEVTAAGGLCVPVAEGDPDADAALRDSPLVATARIGRAPAIPLPTGSPAAPLVGIRVLDLTRVVAGPVATRTLALLGADVLRIDPPRLPEIPWQHLDCGHGKRSTLLDLGNRDDRTVFDGLLADADVVVLGYRGTALDRLGLSPDLLAERRPGLVVARLSAWGAPDRRGFDSLVQAATGIAWIESADGSRPGALPAQALDHSAGYLLAAAVMDLLGRRAEEGGSWVAETSLRRVAAELLGMPRRTAAPEVVHGDATGHLQRFEVDGAEVVTAAPAIAYVGAPTAFAPPRTWGGDLPAWRDAPSPR